MISRGYRRLSERIDALQVRERVLLLVAAVALVYFLVDSLGFQPLLREHRSLLQEIEEQGLRLDVLRVRSSHALGEPSDDESPSLDTLQRELSLFGERLQSRLAGMLSPDRAASVLGQVMTGEDGLVLNAVSARRVPFASVREGDGERVVLGDVDRYELELQLEGGYLETLDYLRALEALPWKVFWESVTFAMIEYPRASVSLDIYTLGRREH